MSEETPVVKAAKAVMMHQFVHGCEPTFTTLGNPVDGYISGWICPTHGTLATITMKWVKDDIETTGVIHAAN